jgi:polyadenylation factor subunit 2
MFPDPFAMPDLLPPYDMKDRPVSSVCSFLGRIATNQNPFPVYSLAWYPDGRQLLVGNSAGELTTWNATTFGFVTIQAHHMNGAVRSHCFSHDGRFHISGSSDGQILLSNPALNVLHPFTTAHTENVRGLSFAPSDKKFVSASDDGKVKLFDVLGAREERVWVGHGGNVKTCDWHPSCALIASAGGQNASIKLWDPRANEEMTTLHEHKIMIHRVKWNPINGNWLLSVARDNSVKVFDIRTMRSLNSFAPHQREPTTCAWHPLHEDLFVTGTFDGMIRYWLVDREQPIAEIYQAHMQSVWDLIFHPLGHCLASGGNDKNVKFWLRNRPGSNMQDKYNATSLPEPLRSQVLQLTAQTRGGVTAQLRKVPTAAGAAAAAGQADADGSAADGPVDGEATTGDGQQTEYMRDA